MSTPFSSIMAFQTMDPQARQQEIKKWRIVQLVAIFFFLGGIGVLSYRIYLSVNGAETWNEYWYLWLAYFLCWFTAIILLRVAGQGLFRMGIATTRRGRAALAYAQAVHAAQNRPIVMVQGQNTNGLSQSHPMQYQNGPPPAYSAEFQNNYATQYSAPLAASAPAPAYDSTTPRY